MCSVFQSLNGIGSRGLHEKSAAAELCEINSKYAQKKRSSPIINESSLEMAQSPERRTGGCNKTSMCMMQWQHTKWDGCQNILLHPCMAITSNASSTVIPSCHSSSFTVHNCIQNTKNNLYVTRMFRRNGMSSTWEVLLSQSYMCFRSTEIHLFVFIKDTCALAEQN